MGPVERAIRATISSGTVLHTTAQSASFVVDAVDQDGVTLLLGAGRYRTPLSWDCLEGVVGFLYGMGMVPVGGDHSIEGQAGTLDGYLKTCTPVHTANYVAVLLETAGVVVVQPGRPVRVGLI